MVELYIKIGELPVKIFRQSNAVLVNIILVNEFDSLQRISGTTSPVMILPVASMRLSTFMQQSSLLVIRTKQQLL